jgi:hypothetical protein
MPELNLTPLYLALTLVRGLRIWTHIKFCALYSFAVFISGNQFCHAFVIFANFEKMPKKQNIFNTLRKNTTYYLQAFFSHSSMNVKSLTLKLPYVVHWLFYYLSTGPMVNRHCKKRLSLFPSPAGMTLTKLSLARKNLKLSAIFTV